MFGLGRAPSPQMDEADLLGCIDWIAQMDEADLLGCIDWIERQTLHITPYFLLKSALRATT
jgi:hypothetical protein